MYSEVSVNALLLVRNPKYFEEWGKCEIRGLYRYGMYVVLFVTISILLILRQNSQWSAQTQSQAGLLTRWSHPPPFVCVSFRRETGVSNRFEGDAKNWRLTEKKRSSFCLFQKFFFFSHRLWFSLLFAKKKRERRERTWVSFVVRGCLAPARMTTKILKIMRTGRDKGDSVFRQKTKPSTVKRTKKYIFHNIRVFFFRQLRYLESLKSCKEKKQKTKFLAACTFPAHSLHILTHPCNCYCTHNLDSKKKKYNRR